MPTKPPAGTLLNLSNPLCTNLVACYALLEGTGGTTADSASGNTGTLNTGSWGTDAEGPTWVTDGASPSLRPIAFTSLAVGTLTNHAYSIAFRLIKNVSDTFGVVFGNSANSTPFVFPRVGTGFELRNNAGQTQLWADANDFTHVHDYVMTIRITGGNNVFLNLYVDGVVTADSPISDVATTYAITGDTLMNGSTFSAGNEVFGALSYFYVWDGRELSSTDVATLASNPFGIFASASSGTFPQTVNVSVMGLP